jgi:hypothetical protein
MALHETFRIPFGKHKGTLIGDAPTSWLKWVSEEPDLSKKPAMLGAGTHGFLTWGQLVNEELARRMQQGSVTIGQALKSNEIDPDDELGEVPPWELPTADLTQASPTKIPRDRKVKVRRRAIDDVSILLLKQFVLRKDKAQGITDFTEELAREVLRYGSEEVRAGTLPEARLTYLDHYFNFDFKDQKEVYLTSVTSKLLPLPIKVERADITFEDSTSSGAMRRKPSNWRRSRNNW